MQSAGALLAHPFGGQEQSTCSHALAGAIKGGSPAAAVSERKLLMRCSSARMAVARGLRAAQWTRYVIRSVGSPTECRCRGEKQHTCCRAVLRASGAKLSLWLPGA